jgi:hypothetical protein
MENQTYQGPESVRRLVLYERVAHLLKDHRGPINYKTLATKVGGNGPNDPALRYAVDTFNYNFRK